MMRTCAVRRDLKAIGANALAADLRIRAPAELREPEMAAVDPRWSVANLCL
jgi:hypothetical protein